MENMVHERAKNKISCIVVLSQNTYWLRNVAQHV